MWFFFGTVGTGLFGLFFRFLVLFKASLTLYVIILLRVNSGLQRRSGGANSEATVDELADEINFVSTTCD